MIKTVNIELKYNQSVQSNEDFANGFRSDLAYCMKRFNINLNFSGEGKSANDFSCKFTVVSNSDLYDSSYTEMLKQHLKEINNHYLIVIDPIRSGADIVSQQKFLSFSFWDQIVETGETRYFRKENKETQHLYWERITDIAFEIAEKISKDSGKKGSIYLAQTDDSQIQYRDNIRRDLGDLGYLVVPNKLFSRKYDESVEQVDAVFNEVDLIIHLIPASYTEYFANKGLSIVEHQCNLSAKHIQNKNNRTQRIIWIPSDFEVVDEKNQIFIEKIQRDQEQSHNTLVLKVNLEDLKKIYRQILAGESVAESKQTALPDLYVIADKNDDLLTSHIDKEAKDAGLRFGINYDGISYNEHLRYLASAQVVVVNYSFENQQWINVKVHDILKSPGLETSKPNKKLVLIKKSKDLDTSHFEKYFNEVHVVEANDIKLNIL